MKHWPYAVMCWCRLRTSRIQLNKKWSSLHDWLGTLMLLMILLLSKLTTSIANGFSRGTDVEFLCNYVKESPMSSAVTEELCSNWGTLLKILAPMSFFCHITIAALCRESILMLIGKKIVLSFYYTFILEFSLVVYLVF